MTRGANQSCSASRLVKSRRNQSVTFKQATATFQSLPPYNG